MANKKFIVRNGITLDGVGSLVNSSGTWTGSDIQATVSSTPPDSAQAGTLWWNSTEGVLKVYYQDSDSLQWVDAAPTIAGDFGLPNVNTIATPTGLYDSDVATNTTFILTSSAYSDNLGRTHTSSDWQVSTDSAFGSTILNVLADTSNLTSYTLDSGLDTAGTYFWRVRYRDNEGDVSNYSANKSFSVTPPPPDTLGQSYAGGFYIGTTTSTDSTCYYLIVAPNATGCARCSWKITNSTTSGAGSCNDGYSNTYGPMDNTDHPAGNFTATRTINGYSDWYLPAKDELNQLYINKGSMPAGEGFCSANAGSWHWSSTHFSIPFSWVQFFENGATSCSACQKVCAAGVRAVRREPI